tara:strand:- start:55 stop:2151 length:2097 start_codon:yes stop_codon:yes gene_type:complete
MRLAHFEFDPEADRLGEGPLSEVFKAKDTKLDRMVALKVLRAHAEIDPQADLRFEREAKHTALLEHPGITTIYELDEDQGKPYIAMEFLEGRTLDKVIRDRHLSIQELLKIAKQLTNILGKVHDAQLIHRDLKPANIMLQPDGHVKLLDFGIARARDEASITQHGMLVGTVLYMSPEQVRGDRLDARSDIFSLGAVLYHLATSALPFPGESFPEVCMAILEGTPRQRPSEIRKGFPSSLEQILMNCMAPEPENRYANGAAVYAALNALGDELTGTTRRAQLEGTLMIPPIRYEGPTDESWNEIAEWVRADVMKSLDRNKKLEVVAGDAPVGSGETDFVLRMSIHVEPDHVDTTFQLETKTGGVGEPLSETMSDMTPDAVVMAEDLAPRAARTARRMLTEAAMAPDPALENGEVDEEAARRLALEAREILHRGRSRHVTSCAVRLRQAKEKNPYCAEVYAVEAEMLVSKYLAWEGDHIYLEESRAAASRALRLDATCALAHTALGFGNHIQGHAEDARREYRLALQQFEDDDAFTRRLFGALQVREGNFKSAAANLTQAIVKCPHLIAAYDHLYVAYARLDRQAEAEENAVEGIGAGRKRVQDVPDDMDARMHLGMLYARLGRAKKAREVLAVAREMAPKDGFTAFRSALVLALIGDTADAIDSLYVARDRGYLIQTEVQFSPELESLVGNPEFDGLFD